MDPAAHRKLVDDFERECKVAGLFAWMRQLGIMQYGPATPTPEQDLVSIDRLSAFRHKVLSFDAIKNRLSHEQPLDGYLVEDEMEHHSAALVDRHLHREWLTTAFTAD
jgi:hypothetical protein